MMMVTAQGADHTAGNLPRLKTREMDLDTLMSQSLLQQTRVAANDSLGLCIFGQSVTNPNTEFLTAAINAAHGTSLTTEFFEALGRDTLRLEWEFNRQAGFTERDDEAAGVLLRRAAPADEPDGAVPRRGRAPDLRPPAVLSGGSSGGALVAPRQNRGL
jgi:aldehyde:ferredoxin oxidoreductase